MVEMTQFDFQRRDKIARTVARNFARRVPGVEYDDALQDARLAYLTENLDGVDSAANPDAAFARCVKLRLIDRLRAANGSRRKTPAPETVPLSVVDAAFNERHSKQEAQTQTPTLDGDAFTRWRENERRERVAGWVARAVEKTLAQSPERVAGLYRAYFERGETLKTAGAAFGLSESRTSQILIKFKRDVAQNLNEERPEK
jgi:DNA-directed RNA polymerase specialized sigma24 family protein